MIAIMKPWKDMPDAKAALTETGTIEERCALSLDIVSTGTIRTRKRKIAILLREYVLVVDIRETSTQNKWVIKLV